MIYLARHATPEFNRTDLVYYLPPGPPLTVQGQAEAQALGLFLKEAGVAKVHSSPLERCAHTAQIISSVTGIPHDVLPGLTELQPGEDKTALRARLWPIFTEANRESENGSPMALLTHGGAVAFLLSELGMHEDVLNHILTFDHRTPLPPAGAWEVSPNGEGQPWKLRLAFTPPPII